MIKKFLIILFLTLLLPLLLFSKTEVINKKQEKKEDQSQIKKPKVLGAEIYLYADDKEFSHGGVISLSSTDDPQVAVRGYKITEPVEISIYESNDDALLDYLTHDKDGKQTKKTPSPAKIKFITTVKKNIKEDSSQVALPLKEKGIWYLKIKAGSATSDAFIVRSSTAALVKEGNNEFIFWGQDFKTKRSINDGVIILYDLENGRKELERSPFNSEGIAKAKLTKDADIALVAYGEDRALIPVNLQFLNSSYNYRSFEEKARLARYFIFTDRPLYKPGDTVYFKTVLREDDDARYSIPSGEASVKIYNGYYYEGSNNKPSFEKTYTISKEGTVSGEYTIPKEAKTGYYSLAVSMPGITSPRSWWGGEYFSSSISFDVQYFRKPEFTIDVSLEKTELISGDKASFKISGLYFSGQPLSGQEVSYAIHQSDFYEYSYLRDYEMYSKDLSNSYRYGSYYGNVLKTGKVRLNNQGEAQVEFNTKIQGKSQIFSIEAYTGERFSETSSYSIKNAIVHSGEFGIYRKDYSYSSRLNKPFSLPIALAPFKTSANVSNIDLKAKIHRENWISYKQENQKYLSWRKEEENLPLLTAKTDTLGNANFTFTPAKTGSYSIKVEGKDSRNNLISQTFYSYISSDDNPYYDTSSGNYELTISTDKQKYKPEESVKLDIFSYIPNRDIFLSLERGRVDRFQTVRLNGNKATVEVPLLNADIPNVYAKISSFDDKTLNNAQANIAVSAESKKVMVKVTPNAKTFGPGETAEVNIETTDTAGNPISADVALWAVDKAIFELSDNRLGNIFDTFWDERGNTTQQAHSLEGILVFGGGGGGCFSEGTKILMSDGKLKNIEDVKIGDYILTKNELNGKLLKAKVTNVHNAQESGYLIINRDLKVTSNHKIWVNNDWKDAGSIQLNDTLLNSKGEKIKVSSIEWQRGKFNVYNLEVEKYHTFFADNYLVHNEKGIERNAFKDTAYWNPSIHTDSSGRAKISFKLPDNLTIWTIAAVSSTTDTKVGQTTEEITVTKDIIVRPILPNILRVDDEIVVSALVQNFKDKNQTFDISLKFDSGDVQTSDYKNMTIKSKETKQLYWKIIPKKEKEKAKLIFGARNTVDNKASDIVTQEIPVLLFGFEERNAKTGINNVNYNVSLDKDINYKKSSITLSLAPTIIGALPSAMKYLIEYPFGCIEQTTSRFVPAVIAKENPHLFSSAFEGKDIDDIIKKGLDRLSSLENPGGGWSWWYSNESDPFITAYVVEYLLKAKKTGVRIDESMLENAKNFLKNDKSYNLETKKTETFSQEQLIPRGYGLALLGVKENVRQFTDFGTLSPDFVSMAVMANYLNGYKDPNTNGLNKLISMAKKQGDSLFWGEGDKYHFGSNDASTAWAIRAILLAQGDRNIAAKGARYLISQRKSDYWSNTYATSQVIRALVDFSKTAGEQNPDFEFKVLLDGKEIAKNRVKNTNTIKDISIPLKKIKSGGSEISVIKNGEGQLYSTILVTKFHTDRKAKAANNGLYIKKEFENEKGAAYTLGVGDVVNVKITVGGINDYASYGVINDELPSGLIPINTSFKNEAYNNNDYYLYNPGQEITLNGMVLSLYEIAPGEKTYTYKARAISSGTFIVPPTTATLMYFPEVNGRSSVESISIEKESKFDASKQKQLEEKSLKQNLVKADYKDTAKIISVLILVAVILYLILFVIKRIFVKKILNQEKDKNIPKSPENPLQ